MITEEHLNFRQELLDQSKDDDGFINQSLLLSEVLPSMLDAKLIDSEDWNNCYYFSSKENLSLFKENPIKSVTTPGVTNNKPPAKIITPSVISFAGERPD